MLAHIFNYTWTGPLQVYHLNQPIVLCWSIQFKGFEMFCFALVHTLNHPLAIHRLGPSTSSGVLVVLSVYFCSQWWMVFPLVEQHSKAWPVPVPSRTIYTIATSVNFFERHRKVLKKTAAMKQNKHQKSVTSSWGHRKLIFLFVILKSSPQLWNNPRFLLRTRNGSSQEAEEGTDERSFSRVMYSKALALQYYIYTLRRTQSCSNSEGSCLCGSMASELCDVSQYWPLDTIQAVKVTVA